MAHTLAADSFMLESGLILDTRIVDQRKETESQDEQAFTRPYQWRLLYLGVS